jgi:hypothetical protein
VNGEFAFFCDDFDLREPLYAGIVFFQRAPRLEAEVAKTIASRIGLYLSSNGQLINTPLLRAMLPAGATDRIPPAPGQGG